MQSMPASIAARIAGVAVHVRRDLQPGAVGLVGDGRELFVGVLLRARRTGVRHDAVPTRRP